MMHAADASSSTSTSANAVILGNGMVEEDGYITAVDLRCASSATITIIVRLQIEMNV